MKRSELRQIIREEINEYGTTDGEAPSTSVDLLSRIADLIKIAKGLEKSHNQSGLSTKIFKLFDGNIKSDWNYSKWKYKK